MSVHRLFVALRPPLLVREQLVAIMGGVPGARWQSDEQLHCTLRFVGEVDHHQAEDIAAALGRVYHPALDLATANLGTFDRGGRIDTLWIGVGPRERAKSLHDRIDRALAMVGIPPDDRAYLPHITLARFSRGNGATPEIVRAMPGSATGMTFRSDAFYLYESQLGSQGASYEAIARYPLEQASAARH